MTQYNGHSEDCLCVHCMMADMDAHVAAQGGTIHKIERTETETTGNRLAGQGAGNGTVRRISEAQVRFISKLIAERDITSLQLLPGQFVDAARIPTMGVKGGSALIEKLLACPVKPTAPKADAPSEKQIAFATTLIERKIGPATQAEAKRTLATLTRREVSEWINELKELPNLAAAAAKVEIEDGMYVLGERIIKVQEARNGSGNLYAKELIDGSFEYVPGLIRKMKDARRMTLDEAKAYGKLYGVCCVCGRDLTDEGSIAAGIGPICAGKF
jgi:hypothetical protein